MSNPNELLDAREIVRAVAETDSTSYNDEKQAWYCPYCQSTQTHFDGTWVFTHEPSCIVMKARAFVERKDGW